MLLSRERVSAGTAATPDEGRGIRRDDGSDDAGAIRQGGRLGSVAHFAGEPMIPPKR